MDKFVAKLRYGNQWGYEVLFKNQDKRLQGKTGIIIGEMGMPEEYDPSFYNCLMEHVFRFSMPGLLANIILQDKGIALIDPENPLAREQFKPRQLIDPNGSFTNKAGVEYARCPVTWKPANLKNPWDHGYFLYTGDGPNGVPDICDKVSAKVIGWYYGKMLPEKRIAWRSQMRKIYTDAVEKLTEKYPEVAFCQSYYMDHNHLRSQVERLLEGGCQTILYQESSSPVLSDFENYSSVFPWLHELVGERARLIFGDQIGNKQGCRQAYLQLLQDQLEHIPAEKSILVILSLHGHPFKKETMDARARLFQQPLEEGVRQLLAGRAAKWDIVWSADEFADDFWDKNHKKLETYAAYRKAIEEGWDYALELPTDFVAENTDTMIFHAMKKYHAFSSFNRYDPVPYPDWEVPLVRRFTEGNTTGIYCGTPVGPYRRHIVQAVVDSISEILG